MEGDDFHSRRGLGHFVSILSLALENGDEDRTYKVA